jgi:hypothetical protein
VAILKSVRRAGERSGREIVTDRRIAVVVQINR